MSKLISVQVKCSLCSSELYPAMGISPTDTEITKEITDKWECLDCRQIGHLIITPLISSLSERKDPQ